MPGTVEQPYADTGSSKYGTAGRRKCAGGVEQEENNSKAKRPNQKAA
jgi:hypothetical protein